MNNLANNFVGDSFHTKKPCSRLGQHTIFILGSLESA